MVLAGLVQLGMDSGLMWELDTDVEEVTRLANRDSGSAGGSGVSLCWHKWEVERPMRILPRYICAKCQRQEDIKPPKVYLKEWLADPLGLKAGSKHGR